MSADDKDALPFEAALRSLESSIETLLEKEETPALRERLAQMQTQHEDLKREFYETLSAWDTVELARHPKRPQTRDYIDLAFDDFEELHGDRAFRDDLAIVTGLGTLGPHRVLLVGEHKGRTVEERHVCHAGCPHPEGYRKALRKMQLAEKFGLPVVTFIDTKGAYPGPAGEERGQGPAIAENLLAMSRLRVPVVCAILGEGGSGGALAIGVGDRILMLRHAYYSVISPEGCASILWRDGAKRAQAAAVLRLTSRDLREFGLIDEIVEEPLGGAHRDPAATAQALREALIRNLDALVGRDAGTLVEGRYAKFRAFGRFEEEGRFLAEAGEAPETDGGTGTTPPADAARTPPAEPAGRETPEDEEDEEDAPNVVRLADSVVRSEASQ
jgi:acetyl-CoA carboxylase carboxyl transferase subunit alpha